MASGGGRGVKDQDQDQEEVKTGNNWVSSPKTSGNFVLKQPFPPLEDLLDSSPSSYETATNKTFDKLEDPVDPAIGAESGNELPESGLKTCPERLPEKRNKCRNSDIRQSTCGSCETPIEGSSSGSFIGKTDNSFPMTARLSETFCGKGDATDAASALEPITSTCLKGEALTCSLSEYGLKKLLYLVQCYYCGNTLKEPVTLACSHSFCKRCLLEHHRISEQEVGVTIKCMQCNTRVKITENKPIRVSKNVVLKELLDVFEEEAESRGRRWCCRCKVLIKGNGFFDQEFDAYFCSNFCSVFHNMDADKDDTSHVPNIGLIEDSLDKLRTCSVSAKKAIDGRNEFIGKIGNNLRLRLFDYKPIENLVIEIEEKEDVLTKVLDAANFNAPLLLEPHQKFLPLLDFIRETQEMAEKLKQALTEARSIPVRGDVLLKLYKSLSSLFPKVSDTNETEAVRGCAPQSKCNSSQKIKAERNLVPSAGLSEDVSRSSLKLYYQSVPYTKGGIILTSKPNEGQFDCLAFNRRKRDLLVATRRGCYLLDVIEEADLSAIEGGLSFEGKDWRVTYSLGKLHLNHITSIGFIPGGRSVISSGQYVDIFDGYDRFATCNPKYDVYGPIAHEFCICTDKFGNIYISESYPKNSITILGIKPLQVRREINGVNSTLKDSFHPHLVAVDDSQKEKLLVYVSTRRSQRSVSRMYCFQIENNFREDALEISYFAMGSVVSAIAVDKDGIVMIAHFAEEKGEASYCIEMFTRRGSERLRRVMLSEQLFEGSIDPLVGMTVTENGHILVLHRHVLYSLNPQPIHCSK